MEYKRPKEINYSDMTPEQMRHFNSTGEVPKEYEMKIDLSQFPETQKELLKKCGIV